MKSPHRWIALALALASACAFSMSVWVGTWWTIGEVTVGPFGTHACFNNDCSRRPLEWLSGGGIWMRSAVAAGVAGVVASFLAVMVAGALAAGRAPRLVARSMTVAIATALVTGGYFVFGFPGVFGAEAHVALGIPLYGAGCALGIAAAVLVIRAAPPARSG
jgi:hypothetical protein